MKYGVTAVATPNSLDYKHMDAQARLIRPHIRASPANLRKFKEMKTNNYDTLRNNYEIAETNLCNISSVP